MNVQARALTDSEKTALYPVLNGSTPDSVSIPFWGKVYATSLGTVLLFDGADGRRRFTLLSGPDVGQLVSQINLPVYVSPDAGLLAFLNDLTRRAVDTGTNFLHMAMLVLFLVAVTKVSR